MPHFICLCAESPGKRDMAKSSHLTRAFLLKFNLSALHGRSFTLSRPSAQLATACPPATFSPVSFSPVTPGRPAKSDSPATVWSNTRASKPLSCLPEHYVGTSLKAQPGPTCFVEGPIKSQSRPNASITLCDRKNGCNAMRRAFDSIPALNIKPPFPLLQLIFAAHKGRSCLSKNKTTVFRLEINFPKPILSRKFCMQPFAQIPSFIDKRRFFSQNSGSPRANHLSRSFERAAG